MSESENTDRCRLLPENTGGVDCFLRVRTQTGVDCYLKTQTGGNCYLRMRTQMASSVNASIVPMASMWTSSFSSRNNVSTPAINTKGSLEGVPSVEVVYLVFTRIPVESYRR